MKKTKTQGFKYHKFIKNFALFTLAVINSIYAALYFSGAMYSLAGNPKINADVMYTIFGSGLKTLDIVYGCLLGLATIMALFARYRLAKGFKNGVYITCGLLVYQGFIPFVYSVWTHSITASTKIINLKNVCFLSICAGVAFLTFEYYSKREEMFKK